MNYKYTAEIPAAVLAGNRECPGYRWSERIEFSRGCIEPVVNTSCAFGLAQLPGYPLQPGPECPASKKAE